MRSREALIEGAVRLDHLSQRVTLGSLARRRLQTRAFPIVGTEPRQR